jgi:hypothetical protein
MRFDTQRYQDLNGRKPRGVGRWAFKVEYVDGGEDVVVAPDTMTLTEAKNWFRDVSRFCVDNIKHVHVADKHHLF